MGGAFLGGVMFKYYGSKNKRDGLTSNRVICECGPFSWEYALGLGKGMFEFWVTKHKFLKKRMAVLRINSWSRRLVFLGG